MAAFADTVLRSPIEVLLERDNAKDLLRFTTAGSVDDGKSTLIGRLLYDSRGVFEDQIRAVAQASSKRGHNGLDLSLLTDGLRAEREQGITIDVAYRYFSTAKRKFIIADTPGHVQYTRNMATGASNADLAILLIDARHGVLPQSRRHASIAKLLGIPRLVVAVNKMDAAGYDEAVFEHIRDDFSEVLKQLRAPDAWFVPISALKGDNVVHATTAMPWFNGPSLLEYLETVELGSTTTAHPFRMPVQYVIRPDQAFRGYAGQIASGTVRPGDEVIALPAGRRSRVKRIVTFDGELTQAHAPMSVTVTLEDEIDISRGDMLAVASTPPQRTRQLEADVVWMSEQPLDLHRTYLLKHTSQTVKAQATAVLHRLNVETMGTESAKTLELNAIGVVRIETAKPLFADAYETNRITGSFILIDPVTNATSGAGMIRRANDGDGRRSSAVSARERALRYGHSPALVRAGSDPEIAQALERRLFDHGCAVVRLDREPAEFALRALLQAGLLVIVPGGPDETVDQLFHNLEEDGVLSAGESLVEGEGI